MCMEHTGTVLKILNLFSEQYIAHAVHGGGCCLFGFVVYLFCDLW